MTGSSLGGTDTLTSAVDTLSEALYDFAKDFNMPCVAKVVLSDQNAFIPKARVSSRVFRHKLEAPTLPPVTCITEYKRDAASNRSRDTGA